MGLGSQVVNLGKSILVNSTIFAELKGVSVTKYANSGIPSLVSYCQYAASARPHTLLNFIKHIKRFMHLERLGESSSQQASRPKCA